MELPVRDTQGQEVGRRAMNEAVFGVPMNQALLHQALVMHQANQRQGTSSTKTRAMVSGGGRKPRPQKGSGRSRQGSIRSPQWRKGGIVFGPHPRSYRQRMPRKMRRLAIRCALSDKVREERLTLVQWLAMPQPRTGEMARILSNLGVNSSALVVLGAPDPGIVRAVRNLPRVKTIAANLLNVLDLLRYDHVLMAVEAAQRVEELWAPKEKAAEGAGGDGAGEVPAEQAAPEKG